MSTAAAFNRLGQRSIPSALARAFPDTLSVVKDTPQSDGGGGFYSSVQASDYTNIPCAYEPKGGTRYDSAGKLLSNAIYLVTMPTHYSLNGTPTRINLNPAIHRLVVNTRGNEPAKTFRIVKVGDDLGVVYEVVCDREN